MPQKFFTEGKTDLAGHLLAVAQTQHHKSHAQAVQGRGPAVGLGRIIQVSAHPRGLIFHARIQGVFRRQAGNRVRARGPGTGQIFQAERDHGRQRGQKRPYFARAYSVKHEHAQQFLPPDQRQQKTTLARQKLRRVRRVLGGKIQGVPVECKKGGQAAAQQAFHVHQIAAREIQVLRNLLHFFSVVRGVADCLENILKPSPPAGPRSRIPPAVPPVVPPLARVAPVV